MRLTETDNDSTLSVSFDSTQEAGPSSTAPLANGHNGVTKTNGYSGSYANGNSKTRSPDGIEGRVAERSRMGISRVSLPGSTLYDDSTIDREEFVRLVIQSLRDVGYIESAATLEAESGYTMESAEVSEFRQCILDGDWDNAEAALLRLGVADEDGLWEARFYISQQKYLELLEAGKTGAALTILRQELAPLNVEPDQLHSLSSLLMCADSSDLRQRANWDGASGTSRRRLLVDLQRYIPSSVMIPQRRFATLLDQARNYQQNRCLYHNAPTNARTFSLYTDHLCDEHAFPRVATAILDGHTDEVWNLQWSHSGNFLATASKDNSAIIWRVGTEEDPSTRDYCAQHILREHPFPVGCVAWSLDDSILLTAAENYIRMWNTRTGVIVRVLDTHTDVVTALVWLPDGSGFISGGLDRKIILWDADGKQRDTWGRTPIRVTDLAITPDYTRLVAIGMYDTPAPPTAAATDTATASGGTTVVSGTRPSENRVIVYDLATKQPTLTIRMEGELTSVKISQDSRYALINRSSGADTPCEIHLWDLKEEQLVRKYTGQTQSEHVIRSCFGGVDDNFIASGSEDGHVYLWHRDTGTLLEDLAGHGNGSVNAVAWNPNDARMLATCSDDHTIRIWEAAPTHPLSLQSHLDEVDYDHSGKGKGKGRGSWAGIVN